MSEKASRMSDQTINWPEEISVIAGPYTGNRKSWLATVADRARVEYRQIRALFYQESADPKDSVGQKIRAAAAKAREQSKLNEARRDARELADIYRRHAQALAVSDPDFHRPEIDALVAAARILGGGDRA